MNGRNLLWLFGFGFYLNLLAAQDATFEPFNEGMYLINPSYRVDFDLDSRTAFWVHYELNAREIAGVANLQKTLPDGVTITGIECSPSVITVSKSFFLARIQFRII